MSSNLVPCPHCIAQVRKDNLNSHINKVHNKPNKKAHSVYRSIHTHQAWSWDRRYYYDYSYNAYSYDDNWSDASQRNLRDTHSYRSSPTSPSEVSDYQSRSADYLADSSDTGSLLSNASHGKLGRDNSWIVFSSPTSVLTQRRSDGFKCPLPQCRERFAEVEYLIQHADSKHDLERCPYCKGVNLKNSRTLEYHIEQIHHIEPQHKRVISPSRPRPSSSGGNGSTQRQPSTTNVTPRKDKLISNHVKLQTSKNSVKSKSITPVSQAIATRRPPSEKIKQKPESENIELLNSNSITKSVQPWNSGVNKKGLPLTDANKQPKKINEEQQINTFSCSPIPTTAVVKSKLSSRPNTPNTKGIKTLGTSVLISANPTSEERRGEVTTNGTDKIEMGTDEDNFMNSHRDPELEKDANFQFIDMGDLIGYSLNIR